MSFVVQADRKEALFDLQTGGVARVVARRGDIVVSAEPSGAIVVRSDGPITVYRDGVYMETVKERNVRAYSSGGDHVAAHNTTIIFGNCAYTDESIRREGLKREAIMKHIKANPATATITDSSGIFAVWSGCTIMLDKIGKVESEKGQGIIACSHDAYVVLDNAVMFSLAYVKLVVRL